jgi:NADH dehydrogenase/NADH:ubiquinone oxidoreductase subunit G
MKGIINGKKVTFKSGQTILQVAKDNNIKIPTLCYMEACNEIGFCRLCVVEVEGKKDLVSSCDTEMENKMVIETKNERI